MDEVRVIDSGRAAGVGSARHTRYESGDADVPFEPLGSVASSSSETTVCCRTFCVSTSGLAPVTVIVSERALLDAGPRPSQR
jgi:hypothetical protein